MKDAIKEFLPPVVTNLFRALRRWRSGPPDFGWSGDYASWSEALQQSRGYHDKAIFDKVVHAYRKVKAGEAVYERDSITFTERQFAWPLLAVLAATALDRADRRCRVLDVGGSLGTSYHQARDFFDGRVSLHWTIIEQPHIVAAGQREFATDELNFYPDIDSLPYAKDLDCILLSGVLQYIENTSAFLQQIFDLQSANILIDRTPFIDAAPRITVQSVGESIYRSSYPSWLFCEADFLALFRDRYQVRAAFESSFDGSGTLSDGCHIAHKGFWLSRIA